MEMQVTPRTLTRREFVRNLSAAAAGGGLLSTAFAGCMLSKSQRAEAHEAVVDALGKLPKRKLSKRLGGMEVSRIVWCQDNQRDLLAPCLQAGMNFVHKAGYYGRRGLPDELKSLPRESFFCDTTVDNTSPGHDPTNYDEAYGQVNRELEATGLKYFDIFRAHYGWHTLASFNKGDNASYRAFKQLKKEGKVKYFAVSQHTKPEDYETYSTMIQEQIDSGLVDSMQVWLSYATDKDSLAVLKKAHDAGIAITAMKTVAHGGRPMSQDANKQAELKAPGMVGRSCVRYVLGLPYVDCCVSSLHSFEQMEENLGAVAAKTASADGFTLHLA